MAKNATPKQYVSVESKIAVLEASKVELTNQLNSAPEDQKAGLTEQIAEADRKIRWYQGRQKSAKFQAKAQAAATAATTPVAEPVPVPEVTSDPRNG